MPISILDPINESIHVEIAQAHLLLVISLMNPVHIHTVDVLDTTKDVDNVHCSSKTFDQV